MGITKICEQNKKNGIAYFSKILLLRTDFDRSMIFQISIGELTDIMYKHLLSRQHYSIIDRR